MFKHQDKIIHAFAYALLAMFTWRYFRYFPFLTPQLFIWTLIFASFYGVTDEFHQSFVVGRQADVWDWLADTIGAYLALSAWYRYKKFKRVEG